MDQNSDLNQYLGELPGSLVEGVAAVFQHIDNLCAISQRELLWLPTCGMNLEYWLWKPVDAESALGIYSMLVNGLRTYEPRVTVNAQSSVAPVPSELLFDINLVLGVRGTLLSADYTTQILSLYRRNDQ